MSGTAVTLQAGARSRWANIFAGVFVVPIVLLLADLVKLVPMAGLGGLLLVVGFQNIQPESIRAVWATGRAARAAPAALGPGEVRVLRIRGSLFFASAQVLEPQLPQVACARGTTLILVLRDVDDLGSTVIRLLTRYAAALRRAGGTLMLAGVSEELRGQLERTGLAAALGPENVFMEQPDLGVALNEPIAAARARTSRPPPDGAPMQEGA